MSNTILKSLSAVTLAMAVSAPAHATIVSAASEGNALSAAVDVLGIDLLDLDLLAQAEGSTPGTYSEYNGLPLSVSAGIPLVATADVGAGLIYGEAGYDGTTTSGGGGIEGLGLTVDGLLGMQYLGLSADSLFSTSSVTGDYGSWTPAGDSVITNLVLSLLGSTLNLSAYAHAAPNTVVDILGLLGIAGVHLTLNEQAESCVAASCGIETNALHLWVDPLNLDLVGTDIVLGHSWAEMSAVPSAAPLPGTVALMFGGLGVLGSLARRRVQTY